MRRVWALSGERWRQGFLYSFLKKNKVEISLYIVCISQGYTWVTFFFHFNFKRMNLSKNDKKNADLQEKEKRLTGRKIIPVTWLLQC